MARLRLLPGERELVRLRPAPAAWLGRYLLALGFAAYGAFLASPLADELQPTDGPSVLNWLVPVAIVGLPVAAGALLYATRRKWVRLGLCTAGAIAFGAAFYATDAWLAVAIALSLVAFALAETDRRWRAYHLTNLRMLHHGGLWDNTGWTVHYDAVLDVDARQSPVGRLLGYGQLEPVIQRPKTVAAPTKRRKIAVPSMSDIDLSAPPRMDGVGPFPRVRHLVACFIQDATATPYLKAEQDTARRVSDAIRALGGANVLRR